MSQGPVRTPTPLLKLKGTFKHSPAHYREQRGNEPEGTDPIRSEPPEWMNEEQAEEYRVICRNCHLNVLSIADEQLVQMVACLFVEFRTLAKKRVLMRADYIGKLMNGLSILGMTPASRSKVQAIKRDDEKKNPFNQERPAA